MLGLKESTIKEIQEAIAQLPAIEKAVVYGSRAKGNYRRGSDIDLTLFGADLTHENSLYPLMEAMDESYLPYSFDISIFEHIENEKLKDHILRVGKVLFERKTYNTMKKLPIQTHFEQSSTLAYGCMGLGGGWNQNPVSDADVKQANDVIDAALEVGINFFDHADIYTFGKAEEVFGRVLKDRADLREQLIIQSKCAIRFPSENAPNFYDFSKEWITYSVDNILKRLQAEHLDILLLHRPDPLMEPEEIAETFAQLKQAGKVKYFGVSNMPHHQMAFLQSALDEPLVVNQLEMSLNHLNWLEESVTMGTASYTATNFAAGTLEYCRQNNVQLQAWGSLAKGLFTGRDIHNESEAVKQTAQLVAQYAENYRVSKEAIVLAWLRRHPANIQPVIGTTNIDRIKACAQVNEVQLSREEWNSLYVRSRGENLP